MTALLYAARQNDLESARILIEAAADVKENAADSSSPLLVATINDHFALAEFLGANPNARLTKKTLRGQPSFDGRWANLIRATPLWRAAQSDDVTVMRLLKDHGADPLIPTNDHTTVLMVAAGVGWSERRVVPRRE